MDVLVSLSRWTSVATAEAPATWTGALSDSRPATVDGRLRLIDAFRAMAALMVFGFHIAPALGGFPAQVLSHGWLGVQVFFAISGFVIAHSVGFSRITVGYVGNFVFRRSVRLDPPYWLVIALALVLLAASKAVLPDSAVAVPAWGAVLAHMLYLQNILGYGDMIDVFWSLCIEVQLYLVFVLLLGVVQSFSPDSRGFRGRAGVAAVAVFVALAILSFAATPWFGLRPKVWFLTYWNQFFLGALAAWVLKGRVARGWFLGYAGIVAVAATFLASNIEDLTALATAVVIVVAGQRGWLHGGMNWSGLQGFGRLSYSFYLVHTLVLARLTRLVARGGVTAAVAPFLVIPLGFVASVVAAWSLYRWAELPCVHLSKRLKPAFEQ
jgi:peptidoglycan/LPS O-acetylase OafA/YrhL